MHRQSSSGLLLLPLLLALLHTAGGATASKKVLAGKEGGETYIVMTEQPQPQQPVDDDTETHAMRSIGVVPVSERDFDPDKQPEEDGGSGDDVWASLRDGDAHGGAPPGAPGALGHYPRPVPFRGSRPPAQHRKKKGRR
ncbi:hypothetical protein B0H66DRAFT_529871 [Apodospora peruviana]|uniref:Uncharacterized protein n=1 Tax=Apodospora peruviana TaxID=516989 RepID=A0AAE0IK54_9PEZI|nr:hypothetical protein B0H66DRAFT_529871 [Apodospora peruviana]